jgi:hypothetical protein
LSRDIGFGGAESKDLGGAYFTHAARSFSTTEAGHGFSLAENQGLASIKCMKRCTRDYQVRIAADPVVGLSGVEKLRTAWVK